MGKVLDKAITTRKVGAEDFIMMRLPSDRFRSSIPSHYTPPVDGKSQFQAVLLAQVCASNSFDSDETGQADELHLWLQVTSSNAGALVKGADIMLPTFHWFALSTATSNAAVRSYLQSFGFSPMDLNKIDLREHGGSLSFPDGGRIEWTIVGPGKRLPRVGVNHVLFVTADEPGADGHRIAALVSDTEMEQPGRIHIQTAALEPFLLEGERFAAVVYRMSKLEADVVWRQH